MALSRGKIMKVSNDTYNNLVNEVLRSQQLTPFKDLIQIIDETLRDYELHLKDLSEAEKSDLKFQLAYSVMR